jgi:hypothetical protein
LRRKSRVPNLQVMRARMEAEWMIVKWKGNGLPFGGMECSLKS